MPEPRRSLVGNQTRQKELICRSSQRLVLLLPLVLAVSMSLPSQIVPPAHAQFTGLVCITASTTATSCPASPPTLGPFTVGQTFTDGLFVQGSDAMGGWDIYVAADPAFVSPTSAALGTLVANPSLTSICINGAAQTGSCTPNTANGPGVVEVNTMESSGLNECGGISPCSGMAFTITYQVVGMTPSTPIFFPSAPGCDSGQSSLGPTADVCVTLDDSFGDTLPENIQGATFTQPLDLDYSLSNNGPVSIARGSSSIVILTAKMTAGSYQPVTLSCVGSSLPSGIACGFFPDNHASLFNDAPTATTILMINVGSSVKPGSYGLTVTGSPLGLTTTPTTVGLSVTNTLTQPQAVWMNQTPYIASPYGPGFGVSVGHLGVFVAGGAYASRYDFNGSLVWVSQVGSALPSGHISGLANAIAVGLDGVYAVGYSYVTGYSFVEKFDFNGNSMWIRPFSAFTAESVSADSTGVYVVGGGGCDIKCYGLATVEKFDSSGNEIWARHIRFGNYTGEAGGVALGPKGVYVVGLYNCPIRVECYPSLPYTNFLTAFDHDGNELWTRASPGWKAVAVGPTGVYDLGSGFVERFDFSGNTIWTRQFGGEGISADSSGVYIVGYGGHVQHLDSNGTLTWSISFGMSTVWSVSTSTKDIFVAGTTFTGPTFVAKVCASTSGIRN